MNENMELEQEQVTHSARLTNDEIVRQLQQWFGIKIDNEIIESVAYETGYNLETSSKHLFEMINSIVIAHNQDAQPSPSPPPPPPITQYERIVNQAKQGIRILIIMRGLPGSGKSHLARKMIQDVLNTSVCENYILSADDYFIRNGQYRYDPSRIPDAHRWLQQRAKSHTKDGLSPLIIDNTNLQAWEMRPYIQLAVDHSYVIELYDMDTSWSQNVKVLSRRNQHGVPKEKLQLMLERYETNLTPDGLMKMFGLTYINDPPKLRTYPPVTSNTTTSMESNDYNMPSVSRCASSLVQFRSAQMCNVQDGSGCVDSGIKMDANSDTGLHPFKSAQMCNIQWDRTGGYDCGNMFGAYTVPQHPPPRTSKSEWECSTATSIHHPKSFAESGQHPKTSKSDWDSANTIVQQQQHQHQHPRTTKSGFVECGTMPAEGLNQHPRATKSEWECSNTTLQHHKTTKSSERFVESGNMTEAVKTGITSHPSQTSKLECETPSLAQIYSNTTPPSTSADCGMMTESNTALQRLKTLFKHEDDKKLVEILVKCNGSFNCAVEILLNRDRDRESTSSSESEFDDLPEVPSGELSETVEINLGDFFVSQLKKQFGDEGVNYPDLLPVIDIPIALGRQLHALYVESIFKQLETQNQVIEMMIKEDEEFARELQFKEIEDGDLNMVISNPVVVKLKESFPDVSTLSLNEILRACNDDYKETVRLLVDSGAKYVGVEVVETTDDADNVEAASTSKLVTVKHHKVLDANFKQKRRDGDKSPTNSHHDDDNHDLDDNDESNLTADQLRKLAFEHQKLRDQLKTKAVKYFNTKSHAIAAHYSEMSRKQTRLYEKYNNLAAERFLNENFERLNHNIDTIDLHSLYVQEALIALDIFIDKNVNLLVHELEQQQRSPTRQQQQQSSQSHHRIVFIITGRGKNSFRKQPRIKPAVEIRLQQRKIKFEYANPGLIRAKVLATTKITSDVADG